MTSPICSDERSCVGLNAWSDKVYGSSSTELFSIVNRTQDHQAQPNMLTLANERRFTMFDTLLSIAKGVYAESPKEEKILSPWYNRIYLQFKNDMLQNLANEITAGLTTNDEKATAIIRYTLRNFPYVEDQENYGYAEFWAPPTFALRKGSGDCEDGAFIVHTLLLHSGVPRESIRTYGGLVVAGDGAALGGHAWTAYRRESDNEWVVLDTSYYPTMQSVENRPLMKTNELYVENWFYFDSLYWTNTNNIDRIHNPGAVTTYSSTGNVAELLPQTNNLFEAYA